MSKEEGAILVIGAGVAGLAAARDLALAGLQVKLIEARDRIGGRVFTEYDNSSPVPIELGAEFVHGKPPELLSVIENARLPFCDAADRHWYFDNGVLSRSTEFWRKLNELMNQLKITEPDRSFKDFIQSLPDDAESRRAKAIAVRYVEGFHAARPERIGVHGLIKANEAEEAIEGDISFRILSGYDCLASSLCEEAKEGGTVVHLNTVVNEIKWGSRHVEAICTSGSETHTFVAPRAVITLPLGVLQAQPHRRGALSFAPELPAEKQSAIKNLEMGQAVKINLRFRSRFWEDLEFRHFGEDLAQLAFVHYPDAALPTWWTLLPVRAPILVGWVGGPAAEVMVQHDNEFILRQALVSLSRMFRVSEADLHRNLEASYIHNWHSDVFARGAYAYVPVDGLDAQEALARPVDNTLFFAGEATSVGHIGTVHGALISGQRAAKEVTKNLEIRN